MPLFFYGMITALFIFMIIINTVTIAVDRAFRKRDHQSQMDKVKKEPAKRATGGYYGR